VRIEGHTDSRGFADLNKKLSAARAASVVRWLVDKGIAADRLTSAGFGPERPIDSNATELGRQNHRRVEFHIE
jgi:OmpA-OmpF porin, OOP family